MDQRVPVRAAPQPLGRIVARPTHAPRVWGLQGTDRGIAPEFASSSEAVLGCNRKDNGQLPAIGIRSVGAGAPAAVHGEAFGVHRGALGHGAPLAGDLPGRWGQGLGMSFRDVLTLYISLYLFVLTIQLSLDFFVLTLQI